MKPFLVLVLAVVWVCGLGAQGWDGDQTSLPVPPSSLARQSEFSQGLLFRTPVERLKKTSVKEASGVTVSARVVKKGTGENLLWELRWEPGEPWGPGTWVVFRDGLGQLREARLILLEGVDDKDNKVSQPGTWIRLVPQGSGNGCRMDLFLAGRLVSGGWVVPGDLVDILGSSDSWLWDHTSGLVDWASVLPQRRWEDEKVEAFRNQVHKLLSTMPLAPGTLWWPDPRGDSNGSSENGAPWGAWTEFPGHRSEVDRGLGPWGVTLWVSDGVLRGWNGSYPTWNSLMEPRVTLPGYSGALVPDDPTQSPSFSFDWIRNLALGVFTVLHPSRPQTNSSADVQNLPFLFSDPASGYTLEDLPALIHLLAITQPGRVYLIAKSTQASGPRGTSNAVSFGEPAVLVPWVGQDNRVRAVVYPGPQEVSLGQWVATGQKSSRGGRPDHLVLTALPLPPSVDLPRLPAR